MNKEKYINELSKKLNYDAQYTKKIVDILDNNFIIGKNNKEKTIKNLTEGLGISVKDADNIYNVSRSIIVKEIKDKLIHPFKNSNNN